MTQLLNDGTYLTTKAMVAEPVLPAQVRVDRAEHIARLAGGPGRSGHGNGLLPGLLLLISADEMSSAYLSVKGYK